MQKKSKFHHLSIESITFSEDSQLQSIGNQAFFMLPIRSITLPSKFERFDKKWCSQTFCLNEIIVSPHNRNFQWYDNKILIGKSDQKSDVFDELIFARRNIDALNVPPFIKKICPYAFNNCCNIRTINISEDSELRYIGYQAFTDSKIRNISIPSKFEEFDEDIISPLNKLFQYIDDQIIVSKLDRKSEIFDLIVYARRNINEIIKG